MTLTKTAPTKTMSKVIGDLLRRADACQERYNIYDARCSRRSTHDALVDVRRCLGAVDRWLAGENDQPVAWMSRASTQEGRDTYRTHYAADSLVAAEHHILVAEFFAGLRDRDSAGDLDPWRYVDHIQQAETERLRLAEGTTWFFNTKVGL